MAGRSPLYMYIYIYIYIYIYYIYIYHETGNGWSLATVSAWKNSVNAAVRGVG